MITFRNVRLRRLREKQVVYDDAFVHSFFTCLLVHCPSVRKNQVFRMPSFILCSIIVRFLCYSFYLRPSFVPCSTFVISLNLSISLHRSFFIRRLFFIRHCSQRLGVFSGFLSNITTGPTNGVLVVVIVVHFTVTNDLELNRPLFGHFATYKLSRLATPSPLHSSQLPPSVIPISTCCPSPVFPTPPHRHDHRRTRRNFRDFRGSPLASDSKWCRTQNQWEKSEKK